jgi:hypothetical protein
MITVFGVETVMVVLITVMPMLIGAFMVMAQGYLRPLL